jgi:metacaspase-1
MTTKVALCVGQNRYSPGSGVDELRGCVNDALLIGELLRVAGFEVRQIHDEAATQSGILERLSVEVAKLRKGDQFVFWNSSHGYQVNDRSGDELLDYRDEAICTYDNDPRVPLSDDKFGRIISRADPEALIFFGSDSCHSGTLTRNTAEGQDERQPRRWLPPEDVRFRTGEALIDLDKYVSGMGRQRRAEPVTEIRQFGRFRRRGAERDMRHLLLSGCKSEEVSWDAPFPPGFHGAMTFNFATAVLQAWKDKKPITYAAAHKAALRGLKRGKFNQTPQLEGPRALKNEPVFGHLPS